MNLDLGFVYKYGIVCAVLEKIMGFLHFILYSSFFAQHEQKFQKKLDSTRGLKQNPSNLKKILLFFGG